MSTEGDPVPRDFKAEADQFAHLLAKIEQLAKENGRLAMERNQHMLMENALRDEANQLAVKRLAGVRERL